MRIKGNKIFSNCENTTVTKAFVQSVTNCSDMLFVGRAATGLYLLLVSIKKRRSEVENPEIILPALSCSTAANCALMAGFKVRFADVERESGLSSETEIKKLVNSSTLAIIFIHLFGNTRNLKELSEFCKKSNILLIEDLVHSVMPQEFNINQTGHWSDFSIFSFNAPKILSGGGGLLSAKDGSYLDTIAETLRKPPYKSVMEDDLRKQLALGYRNLHRQLVKIDREDKRFDIQPFFLGLRCAFDALLWLPQTPLNFNPDKEILSLDENYSNRMKKAQIYHYALKDFMNLEIITNLKPGDNCWRFSFLVSPNSGLINFSETMRSEGYHLSNLYWPPNKFFNPKDFCPNANDIASRIINLWVDKTVSVENVRNCAQSLINNILHIKL